MARARRNWTPEEDAQLRRVVTNAMTNNHPLLWREFAKHMPGRSNKDCRKRWWNSLAEGTAKGPWSEEEDARLIEAVQAHGTNWNQVSRAIGSRNSDQCSSHWSQVLDPAINYCDWTLEEDEHLLQAVRSHGTNWSTIASSHQPKRTTLALKNRYFTLRLKTKNVGNRRSSAAHRASSSPSSEERLKVAKARSSRSSASDGSPKKNDDNENDNDDNFDDEDEDDDGDDDAQSQLLHSVIARPSCPSTDDLPHPLACSGQTQALAPTPPDLWSGFPEHGNLFTYDALPTPASSTDYWMGDTTDPSTCINPYAATSNPISQSFMEEPYFKSQADTSMDLPMPLAPQAESTTGGIGGNVFREDFFEGGLSSENENVAVHTPGFPAVKLSSSGADSSSLHDADSPSKDPTIGSVASETGLYQVSMDMTCSSTELKNVMVWLVGAGSRVNVKIGKE